MSVSVYGISNPRTRSPPRRDANHAASTFLVAAAVVQANGDAWEFAMTPHLWLPTLAGRVEQDVPPEAGGGLETNVAPTDWLDLLNCGVLVAGSAPRERIGLISDVVYPRMGGDDDGGVVWVEQAVAVGASMGQIVSDDAGDWGAIGAATGAIAARRNARRQAEATVAAPSHEQERQTAEQMEKFRRRSPSASKHGSTWSASERAGRCSNSRSKREQWKNKEASRVAV